MSFLADNCTCGQTLLQLVAQANSTIAELMQLAEFVPPLFRLDTKLLSQKYGEVILDFIYFKSPEIYDRKIENLQNLKEVAEEISESHSAIIGQIYTVFVAIHQYVSELNNFLEELNDGLYIQLSLESVFCDPDGKQLMCEALYLYGVMLLMVDSLFPGTLRERIIVAYHRHVRQKISSGSSIEEVSRLMRSTGFTGQSASKRPLDYPENFFQRIKIPEKYINLVVGYLRSDDIYHQVQAYPSPDHRSTALANQAAMLYVCLYFTPSTLRNQTTRMREIVDRFFCDNWIISFYMGRVVNLADEWESYKAAKQALNNSLEATNVRDHARQVSEQLNSLNEKVDLLLADESLTEMKVLEQNSEILNILRDCNVVLRWSILHTASLHKTGGDNNRKCTQLRSQVISEMKFNPSLIFNLLLGTAILEHSLSKSFTKLLDKKSEKWISFRSGALRHIAELAEVFAGDRPLARVSKNDKLNSWFKDIGEKVEALDLDNSGYTGRKIIQMIQALKEVKEYHSLEASAGVVQAVNDVIQNLQAMVKVADISEDSLVSLALISDLSYAWLLIDEYTSIMQAAIKEDPFQVEHLRATFFKLASGLELPLLRINQAKDSQLLSVSSYYSDQLVSYIRKVLQIIPETMFSLLRQISEAQSSMKDMPSRLEKDKLKEFAQLDHRYKMAELTQRIAVLAEGVSMTENTLVGVIQVDPKKLLEDGVRRELVYQVAKTLHNGLVFNHKTKGGDLHSRLILVRQQIKSFYTSFEYIQDYINMYCLKMWQEEISRIINYNVQQECNELLKKKIADHESEYQSASIPIPKFPAHQGDAGHSATFIGRLLREILRITNPSFCLFIPHLEKWCDTKSHSEILSTLIMKDIKESIGVAGIIGIDKLLTFLLVKDLQEIVNQIEKFNSSSLESLESHFKGSSVSVLLLQNLSTTVQKNIKFLSNILILVLRVGQMQTLRQLVASELYSSSKLQSKQLSYALETFNRSLMNDITKVYLDPSSSNPDPENQIVAKLSPLLDCMGFSEPFDKIYITPKNIPHFSLVLLLVILSASTKYKFLKDFANENGKNYDGIDGGCLIAGLSSVLRQFPSPYSYKLLEFLSQYATLVISSTPINQSRGTELPQESNVAITVAKGIITTMSHSDDSLKTILPEHFITSV